MSYATLIEPGTSVDLDTMPTDETGGLNKLEGRARLEPLSEELGELQSLLYAAAEKSVLVILQGMDTSGKDGTIRHVLRDVDPLGCRVWPFKQPTSLELKHDFLWRVHALAPEVGMMTVFNRSQYEDVLIVRVKELVPPEVWEPRYDQINEFEALLTSAGAIVLKFFLHISKAEQKERLIAREEDVSKAWKLAVGDWEERRFWDDYQIAYQEALTRCSTEVAPWYVIPADHKWYRDLAIAEAIVNALRPYRDDWLASLRRRAAVQIVEVKKARASA